MSDNFIYLLFDLIYIEMNNEVLVDVLSAQMKNVLKVPHGVSGEQQQTNLERTLLDWCQQSTAG